MSWLARLAIILGLEACWFALLHPLVPSTLLGFIAEFAAGLVVFALVYGGAQAIIWLQGRPAHRNLTRVISVVIAIGMGVVIFAAAYACQVFLGRNFTYWY